MKELVLRDRRLFLREFNEVEVAETSAILAEWVKRNQTAEQLALRRIKNLVNIGGYDADVMIDGANIPRRVIIRNFFVTLKCFLFISPENPDSENTHHLVSMFGNFRHALPMANLDIIHPSYRNYTGDIPPLEITAKLPTPVCISLGNGTAETPFMFVIDDAGEAHQPPVPNVFDDGRICTGGSWNSVAMTASSNMNWMAMLNNLISSPYSDHLSDRFHKAHSFLGPIPKRRVTFNLTCATEAQKLPVLTLNKSVYTP